MKIALACDHGAYDLKEALKKHLESKGHTCQDFGTYSKDSCDYSDFAAPAAKAVDAGECDRGIVCCTTGIGVSITANKVKGVRCALVHDLLTARMTRQHNNTNVLAMGAGIIGEMTALQIADIWLETEFEGGRHERRVNKVIALENE
ncbi:MAG: ribose 5-phosphate isomerase B [Oscillospiraceae bacterium]|nr:ribose 5-phosphate isomerase B [Oscillospiraceae bacterium]